MTTQSEIVRTHTSRLRRRERLVRVGAGFPNPSLVVAPGTAIPSPVTVAQGQEAVTLIWSVESLDGGGDYPDGGTVLGVGGLSVSFSAGGDWSTISELSAITLVPDLSSTILPGGGVPPNGIQTFVVFADPPNNRMGVFLNGVQIAQGTGAHALWSDGVADWTFMSGVSNVGLISDLHIFLDYVPPGFTG